MKILVILCIVISSYLVISVLTILKNGVSLTEAPGLAKRFKTFMTTHLAETSENHLFPELIPQTIQLSKIELTHKIIQSAEMLGWELTKQTEDSLEYIVTTSLVKFKDDIKISLKTVSPTSTTFNIRSESRVGRADFGANLGHIIKFKALLIK